MSVSRAISVSGRARLASVAALVAMATGGCSSTSTPAGLEVVVETDVDPTTFGSIWLRVSQQDATTLAWTTLADEPLKGALPARFALAAGKSADQEVQVTITGYSTMGVSDSGPGTTPLVRRTVQLQVPTTYVGVLDIDLSAARPKCPGTYEEGTLSANIPTTCTIVLTKPVPHYEADATAFDAGTADAAPDLGSSTASSAPFTSTTRTTASTGAASSRLSSSPASDAGVTSSASSTVSSTGSHSSIASSSSSESTSSSHSSRSTTSASEKSSRASSSSVSSGSSSATQSSSVTSSTETAPSSTGESSSARASSSSSGLTSTASSTATASVESSTVTSSTEESTTETQESSSLASGIGSVVATYDMPDGGPFKLAYDGMNVWVTDLDAHEVSEIYGQTEVTGPYAMGSHAYAIAFDSNHGTVWVTDIFHSQVVQISVDDGSVVGTYTVPAQPSAIAFDGTNMWVACSMADAVAELSPDGGLIGTYAVGSNPQGIAFDGVNMWVTNKNDGTVTRLSPTGDAGAGPFDAGLNPVAIAFDNVNMWVTDEGSGTSPGSVTELAPNGTTLGTYGVQYFPDAIAFDGTRMWVANYGSGNVTVLDSYGNVVGTFATGAEPTGIACGGGYVWVANQGAGTVVVLSDLDPDTDVAAPPRLERRRGEGPSVRSPLSPDRVLQGSR